MLYQKILLLFALACSFHQAVAHNVDQFYMELYPEEHQFRAVIFADAAYCLPEYRGDKDKAAPTRDWLLERSEDEHARLKTEAESYIRSILSFMQDEIPAPYEIRFPDYASTPYDFYKSLLNQAIIRIEVVGDYLPTGGSLQARWTEHFGANLLIAVSSPEDPDQRKFLQIDWLPGGNAIDLGIVTSPFTPDSPAAAPQVDTHKAWFTTVKTGFRHVVPDGFDHILFIVGLFLFSPTWRPLLKQSLAFTIAHSVTLALSLMGAVVLPIPIVEIMIALSIVFIAAENIFIDKLAKHRLLIVFIFGLLHGFGFGAVLKVYLSGDDLLLPLLGFNIGVELGQVLVLLVCFALFYWFRDKFKWIRLGGSVIVGLIGLKMVIERIIEL